MNILERIVADKRVEVNFKKSILPLNYLRKSPMIQRDGHSLKDSLCVRSGIIAEFKRRSPSKQVINQTSSVVEVAKGYQEAGASGISVLTDTKYFGGALDDLLQVRSAVQIPVLRKDFMIDPYQFHEAKAYGADAVLLIAAILDLDQVSEFAKLSHDLGLEVLLEVHGEDELIGQDLSNVDMVGVNNRDLKSFTVDLSNSRELAHHIPNRVVKISESGLSDPSSITDLRSYGFEGFLMGETFMKEADPGEAARKFITQL